MKTIIPELGEFYAIFDTEEADRKGVTSLVVDAKVIGWLVEYNDTEAVSSWSNTPVLAGACDSSIMINYIFCQKTKRLQGYDDMWNHISSYTEKNFDEASWKAVGIDLAELGIPKDRIIGSSLRWRYKENHQSSESFN